MSIARKLKELRVRAGLSRDKLAKAAGFERGTSFQRYENEEYMAGRRLPVSFVTRICPPLVGKGSPPITRSEIWGLAEAGSSIEISSVAVTSVPVLRWDSLSVEAKKMLHGGTIEIEDAVEILDLGAGNFIAARVVTDHCEKVASVGSIVVLDIDDCTPRDGARFLVVLNGEPVIRRYQANPERWESEAATSAPAYYPKSSVEIVGRLVRTVKEW